MHWITESHEVDMLEELATIRTTMMGSMPSIQAVYNTMNSLRSISPILLRQGLLTQSIVFHHRRARQLSHLPRQSCHTMRPQPPLVVTSRCCRISLSRVERSSSGLVLRTSWCIKWRDDSRSASGQEDRFGIICLE